MCVTKCLREWKSLVLCDCVCFRSQMMKTACPRRSGPLWTPHITEEEELEGSRGWRWRTCTMLKPIVMNLQPKKQTQMRRCALWALIQLIFCSVLYIHALHALCRCAGEGRVQLKRGLSWRSRRMRWWKCRSRSTSPLNPNRRKLTTRRRLRTGSGTRPSG